MSRMLCGYNRKNTQKMTEYIRNQLKEDREQSQFTMDFELLMGDK